MAVKHTLFSVNCQWNGFASTKAASWLRRVDGFGDAIRKSGASIVVAQELGQDEARQLASNLGQKWSYQRAQGSASGEGLNAVLWRSEWEQDGDTIDVNIPRWGQMARTLCAVPLKHVNGEQVTAFSSHFANRAAKDLTTSYGIAQLSQVKAVHKALQDRRRVIGGIDSNVVSNRDAPRAFLLEHDWHITAHGIDLVVTRPGVVVESKKVVHVPSDHDAIAVTYTTNLGKDT